MGSTLVGKGATIQNQRFSAPRWIPIVPLAILAAVYIGSSCGPTLFDETEGQYAGAARELLEAGNWLVPTNDGVPRLQKPPLVYWLIRLSLGIFGVNDFAARLPNALGTIGWAAGVYLVGVRVGAPARGLFAAAIFSSFCGVFIFSHLIMPEPFLGCFITLAFWCLLSGYEDGLRARRWFAGAWLCMALGVMTKGLHGALIPLLVVGASLVLWPESRTRWRPLWSVANLVLFALLVLPWYAAVEHRFPGFLSDHFINEQLGHAFDHRFPREGEQVPLAVFWAQHLIFFLPWTLFVPAAVRASKVVREEGRLVRFLGLWTLITAVGVTFSARQDYYTMSCWGALAVWMAGSWIQPRTVGRGYFVGGFVLLAALGVSGLLVARFGASALFTGPVQADPAANRGDVLSAVTGFSLGAWRDCIPLMQASAWALVLVGAAGALLAWQRKIALAAMALALSMTVPFAMAGLGLRVMAPYFSLAAVAKAVNSVAKPDAVVVCQGDLHVNSSLFFYLPRNVYWVGAHVDNEFASRRLHIGCQFYLTQQELVELWHSGKQVFLIIEESALPAWLSVLDIRSSAPSVVQRSGTRVVVANGR